MEWTAAGFDFHRLIVESGINAFQIATNDFANETRRYVIVASRKGRHAFLFPLPLLPLFCGRSLIGPAQRPGSAPRRWRPRAHIPTTPAGTSSSASGKGRCALLLQRHPRRLARARRLAGSRKSGSIVESGTKQRLPKSPSTPTPAPTTPTSSPRRTPRASTPATSSSSCPGRRLARPADARDRLRGAHLTQYLCNAHRPDAAKSSGHRRGAGRAQVSYRLQNE